MVGPAEPEALVRRGYDRHGGELYRYALARLGDDASAQDAVQETIVRAWKAGGRYDPARASLRTWLFAIHRNVVIDQLAARRWAASTPDAAGGDPGAAGGDPAAAGGDPAEIVADGAAVVHALGLLSDDHRTAIVETYLRDRPYADVAGELGIPVATLRSRVFHGLRHLRAALSREEV
ncbi:RNA polymerase sigma factor [Williamsia sp. CHRR-6]|uniref:RNA polymerase sigma factor n=1 Tax=Williamsia sp. CHRR-6 TaxID=2835871 RepID=UPI001BDA074C|nr:sigma-70 family RNA polymerase sigma factor [Williamsia sp. CHRR-6]MBT0567762.1 sigma-70 family RNA polymerase sigma factor [Williamsia sp. CHRR-6]